jgi:uncharacterized protein YbaP (TraB family)
MKFHKYITFTLIHFIFFGNSFAQKSQYDNQLLWEISGNGLSEKSYLYGSFHSNDKRLFQFSDSVYFALSKTEAVVLETDVFSLFENWDTRKGDVNVLFDNKGNPYTGTNIPTKTIYGNEDGMPQFLDAYFLEYCHNANKTFFALETVNDQLQSIENYFKPEYEGIAEEAINFTQEKMMDYYLMGDIVVLDKMMKSNMNLFPGMYDDLIIERNKKMADGLDTLLRKNSLFCAIGAGHLAGEGGVINLLRKKGFKLRKVQAVFSEDPTQEKQHVKSSRTYTYVNDSVGLIAQFPGKPLALKIWDNHPYLIYREMGQGNTYSVEIIPIDGTMSLEEQAAIYIASPDETKTKQIILDDETEVYEGISDTYPDGLQWVRLMQNDNYLVIMKAFGGNKFMNSNRSRNFFTKVWFE